MKTTQSFNYDTDLVEVVYTNENQKHKLIIEAAVLNENPKKISFITFDEEGTFYKNGMYNIICE